MADYMPGAEPFDWPGNEVGCLMLHGFTGTPAEVRGVGERLYRHHGFTVLGPALAGHATRMEEMIHTTWQDWYASAVKGYEELAGRCKEVVAIGLSLGGALSLHLAAHRPLRAVVAASAPFRIEMPQEPLFRFMPFLFDLIPYVRKSEQQNDVQDPSVQAAHREYDSNPTRAAASMVWDFLPHLGEDLSDVRAPVLLIQAKRDRMIAADSATRIAARLGSAEKEIVWLDKGGHLAFEDTGREQAMSAVEAFLARHVLQPAPIPDGMPSF